MFDQSSLDGYPDWLNIAQLAEVLSINRLTATRMLDAGLLPHIVIGKRSRRIPKEALITWIQESLKISIEENDDDN